MENDEPDGGNSGIEGRRGGPLAYATDYHAPVLCKAVVDGLIWNRHGVYVDGTLGGGGHTSAMLDVLEPDGRVIGIDQDPDAIEAASSRLRSEVESGRLLVLQGNFGSVQTLISEAGFDTVDGLLLDLGISSHQIDSAERGFSYSAEGELDMRMDKDSAVSAYDLVNSWTESELCDLMRSFGEEPRARVLARRIIEARPLESTHDLAAVIRRSVPQRDEMKTLSRVFQAIRIAVNRELEVLEDVLEQAVGFIEPPGRIAVISYHSLEDRRVKRYLRYGNFQGEPVRDFYGNLVAPWKELTRHPLQPDETEIGTNPRARSARLRIAERIGDESREGQQ